jgi:hypothetical protein
MSNPILAPCRLCLLTRELQLSHSELPAGVYRRLRGKTTGNPNPVLLSEDVCVATSRQPTEHMLCKDCEDLFNRNGEKWILEHCLQPDGTFPLRDIVNQGQQLSTGRVVARSGCHFDTQKLEYFAASIFWRCSVCKKTPKHQDRPVRLGGRYDEDFRRYLLGQAGFPGHTALIVALSSSGSIWSNAAWAPTGERKDGFHLWQFNIPGIMLRLFVGKALPQETKSICLVQSPLKVIQVTDNVDAQMATWVLDYMKKDQERNTSGTPSS